jgi:putative isomerase
MMVSMPATPLSRRSLLRNAMMASSAIALPSALTEPALAQGLPAPTPPSPAQRKAAAQPLLEYFAGTAPKLLRPAQGPLTHPCIAPSLPGARYSTQLWDWDTLWTTRGLFRFARLTNDANLQGQVAEHARGSLLNFFEHQSPEGRLPIVIGASDANAGIAPYAAPNYQNQAKPVMGQLALLISDETGSVDWLKPVFDQLLRFYDSWILGNQTGTGLLVWGDDVMIGNDNDPTTFGRPFFSSANLLLNCLFYQDLRAAQTLSQRLGRPAAEQQLLARRIDKLARAIQQQCWDPRDAFYYTADVQCVDRRAELIPTVPRGMAMSWSTLPLRIQVFTGFLPLWCGLATPGQAAAMVQRNYLADDRFRANYGVRSLSNLETMYSMEFSSNPSNWLGPIWIVVNYLVWKGLGAYGFTQAADDLAAKTVQLLAAGLAADGSLNEYYHPDTGAPLSHKGFMDWNLLVLEML